MPPASSPCIKICVMDGPSGLCQGCGRTLDEIAAWATLGEDTRQIIMAALPDRLRQSRLQRMAAAGRRNPRRPAR